MQKPHRPVRVNKLSCVLQRHIGQAIEIFKISELPIDMVPCLDQCNVYIVRKLRVWRAQKCNFLVSAKTGPIGTCQQTNPCHLAPYRTSNENFRNYGATFCHGTVFAPMQTLYCKKATGVESQKMQFIVSAKTAPTGTGQQTTPCIATAYWASNKNFQKFGATYQHGTVFAPMQCLYCKEATGVEIQKMQFPSQSKNRTDQYGSTHYSVSCCAVFGKQ